MGGSLGIEAKLDITLDVFHHHDGVVNHDTDGQHQTEQGQGIDRKAGQHHHGKGADDRNRHRQQGYDRRPPGLEEQHHHQQYHQDRFEQGGDNRFNRLLHKAGRVVDDAVFNAFGEIALGLFHERAHAVRQRDGV